MEMGGLRLDPLAVGTILAALRTLCIFEFFSFPPLHDCLGGETLFLTTTTLFVPIAALRVGLEQGLGSFVWIRSVLRALRTANHPTVFWAQFER